MRGGASASGIDGRVNALLSAADGWASASFEEKLAQERVKQAQEARNRLADEVAKYDRMESQQATVIAQLRSEIAALDAQLAANPPNRQALEDERTGKVADLTLAQDLALMRPAREKALESLEQAQDDLGAAGAARDTARRNFDQAQNAYQAAYAALEQAAARYPLYQSNGDVWEYGCTALCLPGDRFVNLEPALRAVLGDSVATAPDADSLYLRPDRLRKELEALRNELLEAEKRINDARSYEQQAQTMLNELVPCNVTGSAVTPMTPDQSEAILVEVDRKGGAR